MSCTPPVRTLSFPITVAFSKGGGAPNQGVSDIFVVSDDAFMQIAPLLKAIRTTLVLNNRTENAEVQVVLQPTDNGCTWGTDSVLLAYTTVVGSTTGAWFTNQTEFKRGIRVGVKVRQTTGTAVEMVSGMLIVDLELRSCK